MVQQARLKDQNRLHQQHYRERLNDEESTRIAEQNRLSHQLRKNNLDVGGKYLQNETRKRPDDIRKNKMTSAEIKRRRGRSIS